MRSSVHPENSKLGPSELFFIFNIKIMSLHDVFEEDEIYYQL